MTKRGAIGLAVFFSLTAAYRSSPTEDSPQPNAKVREAAAYILKIDEGDALLDDQGRTTHIKVSPETGSANLKWAATDMPPGSNIIVHRHDRAEEVLFLPKGSGTFILREERIEVQEGATIYVPPGTGDGLENPDEHVHIVFAAVSPPSLENFFRKMFWHPGEAPKRRPKRLPRWRECITIRSTSMTVVPNRVREGI